MIFAHFQIGAFFHGFAYICVVRIELCYGNYATDLWDYIPQH